MLKSKIIVDLPSQELLRSKGPIEWVRSLFGAEIDLRTGKEELTVGAFALLRGIVKAFSGAKVAGGGVTDAISLLVDRKVIYLDTDDVPHDIEALTEAAASNGVFDRAFQEMHVVLTHTAAGLHLLFDLAVRNRVDKGTPEMEVVVSGRVEALRIQAGETAAGYANRIKAYTQGTEAIEAHRLATDRVARELGDRLRLCLVGSTVEVEPARVEIIRPNKTQVGRMRGLEFGENTKTPKYRPVPTRQKKGAYADPFYYYYYDPYYALANVLLLDAVVHHAAWGMSSVHVVDPDGSILFTGDQVQSAQAPLSDWDPSEAVGVGEDGGLSVDDAMPAADVDGDPLEAGLDADGTELEGAHWDGGWDDADFGGDVSSCSSCSNCGSTCASCSSCGGCGGCG